MSRVIYYEIRVAGTSVSRVISYEIRVAGYLCVSCNILRTESNQNGKLMFLSCSLEHNGRVLNYSIPSILLLLNTL